MLLFQKWYSPKNLKACPFTFPSSPEVYLTLSSPLTMSTPTSPSTFRSPQKAFHTVRSVTRTRPLYSLWQTMDIHGSKVYFPTYYIKPLIFKKNPSDVISYPILSKFCPLKAELIRVYF